VRVGEDASGRIAEFERRRYRRRHRPADLRRIFEPFFTTKTGPDASGQGGTGLGLSVLPRYRRVAPRPPPLQRAGSAREPIQHFASPSAPPRPSKGPLDTGLGPTISVAWGLAKTRGFPGNWQRRFEVRWVTVLTEHGPRACGVWQGEYVDINAADPQAPSSVKGTAGARACGAAAGVGGAGSWRKTLRPGHSHIAGPDPRPSQNHCLGLNYRDHAAESGMEIPTEPILFSKYPSSLIGHQPRSSCPRSATRSTTRRSW